MAQTWESLIFAHWSLPPKLVRPRIPAGLTLDLFEGTAWLAITPFLMTGVRPRGIPAVPGLSEFPETNVRTYVTAGGKPGVFFFSLDAGNGVAVTLAKIFYHLPYFSSEMSVEPFGDGFTYKSRRTPGEPPAEFEAWGQAEGSEFRSVPGTLEHFLTERYCLYAAGGGRLYRAEVHHAPWTLRKARAEIRVNTLGSAAGFGLAEKPDLVHFSGRLDVRAWAPEQILPAGP